MFKRIEEKLAEMEAEFEQVKSFTGSRASYLKGYVDALKWILTLLN